LETGCAERFYQARKLNMEDAMDRRRRKKLI